MIYEEIDDTLDTKQHSYSTAADSAVSGGITCGMGSPESPKHLLYLFRAISAILASHREAEEYASILGIARGDKTYGI